MAKSGGNPQDFVKYKVPLANKVTGIRLPVEIDEFVNSLPNKTEWLRKAIAEAYERERGNAV
jgi:hypothetical protein